MPDPISNVTPGVVAPVSGNAAPAQSPAAPVPPTPGNAGDPSNQDVKQVPLAALQEERQRRQESQAQLTTLQAQLAELKGMIGQQQQPQYHPQPVAQPQINPLDNVWNNDEAWEKDPKAAVRTSVQAEILAALQWYDTQSTVIASQEADVMKRYPDYPNYKVQIQQQLRQIPFNQRTQPGVVETAYFMVKGQSVDQILSRQQQELIEKIRRGEMVQGLQPGAIGVPAPAAGGPVQLTDEQLKVAAMMNLTPEQYASSIVRK